MNVVILAGGEGKRMQSKIPKVLHLFHGVPMLVRIIQEALQLSPNFIYIVVGKFRSQIQNMLEKKFPNRHFLYIDQPVPLGTGHAISMCLPYLENDSSILILSGDVPAINSGVLRPFVDGKKNTMITMEQTNPFGYGRIITNNENEIIKIVEEKDANEQEKQVSTVNAGIYHFDVSVLQSMVPKIKNNNAQNEYYFTDIVNLCKEHEIKIYPYALPSADIKYIQGVNTKDDLKHLEKLIKF